MKAVITGNTMGLGAELERVLLSLNHSVRGVSRVSGCDLSLSAARHQFVHSLTDEDLVVLNARVCQTEVMEGLSHSAWPALGRTLVVISSRAPDAGISGPAGLYAAEKAKVDFYTGWMSARSPNGLRVIGIRPGYFESSSHPTGLPLNELAWSIIEIATNPILANLRSATIFTTKT